MFIAYIARPEMCHIVSMRFWYTHRRVYYMCTTCCTRLYYLCTHRESGRIFFFLLFLRDCFFLLVLIKVFLRRLVIEFSYIIVVVAFYFFYTRLLCSVGICLVPCSVRHFLFHLLLCYFFFFFFFELNCRLSFIHLIFKRLSSCAHTRLILSSSSSSSWLFIVFFGSMANTRIPLSHSLTQFGCDFILHFCSN